MKHTRSSGPLLALVVGLAAFGLLLALVVMPANAAASPPPDASNVNLIKQLGGETRAVDVLGSFAYIGVGPRLVVVNAINPANPVIAGQSEPLTDVIEALVYAAPYVYAVNGDGGLHIYNVAIPSSPTEVGYVDTPGSAVGVAFTFHNGVPYAFVADGANGLLIYDVTDRANPVLVPAASYEGGNWANGTQVTLADSSVVSGYAEDVSIISGGINETFVFIAAGYSGVRVWEPFPAIGGAVEVTAFRRTAAEALDGVDPYFADVLAKMVSEAAYRIYIADSITGLRVLDFAEGLGTLTMQNTPGDPFLSGSATALAMGADTTTLYIAEGISGIDKVDVTNPALPVLLGNFDTPGNAVAAAVESSYGFVADSEHGLRLINVGTLSALSQVSGVGFTQRVDFNEQYAFLADGANGLKALDITDPANPVLVGSFEPAAAFYSFDSLVIDNDLAYVVDSLYGLRVISITVPQAMLQVGNYEAIGWAPNDVAIAGTRAYLSAGFDGLHVLDIDNVAAITELGSYSATITDTQGVAIVGTTAYVPTYQDGLHVLNVSNPAAITDLGSYPLAEAHDVVISGSTAYVAAGNAGLQILNVSNPAAITAIGTFDTPGSATGVFVPNKFYAFVADYSSGLQVVDIRTPAAPVQAGFYNTSGTAVAVTNSQYAYVSDQESGLWILDALSSDLSITKTDNKTTISQNESDTYTITVSNLGVHHAAGVVITDTFPTGLLNVTWTCTASAGSACPAANGSGNINGTGDVLSGGTLSFYATGTVNALGTLINTAGVTWPGNVDLNPANNFASDSTATAVADLSITKTDGKASAIPGTAHTYTVTVSNAGPSAVVNATVTDTLPSALSTATWTCAASIGSSCPASGSGNLNASINLLVGGTATFTYNGLIDAGALDPLVNTAGVALPSDTADNNLANNFASDSTTLTPQADLSISKSVSGSYTPGTTVTYTLVVANAGPSVSAATVTDNFDVKLTNVTWTCANGGLGSSCPASGTGNLSASVSLLIGRPVTFTVVAKIDPQASGAVNNTASVAAGGSVTDPNPGNNSASANFTIGAPVTDLAITKTDGLSVADAGDPLTYTIEVSNLGPSFATNAAVADTFPTSVENMTWTCTADAGSTCPASGSGNINTLVSLAVNGKVTFIASGNIKLSAVGSVDNTATVAAAGGSSDPDPSNNSATDSTALSQTDLVITKTDGQTSAVPGTVNVYTIDVTNVGATTVNGATVTDTVPSQLTNVQWTCTASDGACTVDSGTGDINTTVDLPATTGAVQFIITGTIDAAATGTLINRSGVASTPEVADINLANNFATDSTTLTPQFDLGLIKSNGGAAIPGTTITYTIVITHSGLSAAAGTVTDNFAAALQGATWTCAASAGSTCPAAGNGNINAAVTVAPGGTLTFIAAGTINAAATGTLANTASVSASGDVNPNNNSSTVSDALTPTADLSVSKTGLPDPVVAGDYLTYTLQVANAGPSTATSVVLTDTLSDNAQFLGAAASTGSCTTGQTVTCNFGTLQPGSSASLLITVRVNTGTPLGAISNSAVVAMNPSITDPNPANNTITLNTNVDVVADLSITKTHSGSLIPGTALTYTINVANAGPSAVSGAAVLDQFPAAITNVAWTCSASLGSTCGAASGTSHISTTIDLAPGGTATYVANATLAAGASGTVTNTATIESIYDPETANNTAIDVFNVASADLSITKTDGQTSAVPGTVVTYTIVVANAGPDPVTGATVVDNFPAALTGVTWTCTGACSAASGNGNINLAVNVQSGGSVTLVARGTINAAATGTLSNTATVASIIDPNPANNTATDSDTLTPQADLSIAKIHAGSMIPGLPITYTITVVNNGPSVVSGAVITDNFPAAVTGVTWTCTGCAAANGSGNLNTTANLSVGASAVIVARGTLDPAASGQLANTAYVSSVIDPNGANNSATDTVTIGGPQADVSVTKSVATSGVPGTAVTYTVSVNNAGPSAVTGARLVDNFPAAITGVTWTCTGACAAANGSGQISVTLNLAVGGSATFVARGTLDPAATGSIANTATASVPPSVTDPNEANNSATATFVATPQLDASITGVATPSPVGAGQNLLYTWTVANTGPSTASNVQVIQQLPANVTLVSAPGCTLLDSQVRCDIASLAPGGQTILSVTVKVKALGAAAAQMSSQATVFANNDINLSNNQVTLNTIVNPHRLYMPVMRR